MADCRASVHSRPDGTLELSLACGLDRVDARAWRRPGGDVYVLSSFVHEMPSSPTLHRRFYQLAHHIADATLAPLEPC